MGLFSGVSEEEASAKRVEIVEHRVWLEQLNDGDAARLFDNIEKAFNMAQKTTRFFSGAQVVHSVQVMRNLGGLRSAWLSVDRCNLNNRDLAVMYDTVHRFLPDLAGFYRQVSAEQGIFAAYYGINHSDPRYRIARKKAVKAQLAKATDALSSIRFGQVAVARKASAMAKAGFRVPQLGERDAELRETVDTLGEAWMNANVLPLGDADRFYVDQVKERYFPDTRWMLQAFEGGDKVLLGEARAIFLDQVQVMTERLQALVTDEAREVALRQLRAHSIFLRDVSGASEDPADMGELRPEGSLVSDSSSV